VNLFNAGGALNLWLESHHGCKVHPDLKKRLYMNRFDISAKYASVGVKPLQPTDLARSKSFVPPAFSAKQPVLDKRRVAVLPLRKLSPDPNDEYFADGMTEDLISTISNVSGLSVISRTSVMKYKKPERKLVEIGEDLRVGTILEGSVRKVANKVRVDVQLIDVGEDKHLWSQKYDRELEDIFAVQSDIAESVANALEVEVLGEERHRLEGRARRIEKH
jgi:TolB-like protein